MWVFGIVYQELTRITKAIKDGDFFENTILSKAMQTVKANGSALHLLGLVSDGGVHSHISHLFALLEMAKLQGLNKVYVHAFLDGRDVGPQTADVYLAELDAEMKRIGVGKIATVAGRYYAMDRDKRWERVQKAYDAMVLHDGTVYHLQYQCKECPLYCRQRDVCNPVRSNAGAGCMEQTETRQRQTCPADR